MSSLRSLVYKDYIVKILYMSTTFKIVGFTQMFNEIRKGNLERFITHIDPYISELVVYDDGSTDGSYELMSDYTNYIIRSPKNDFKNELYHKQQLLELALSLKPDFILWLDIDEVLSKNTNIQELCQFMVNHNLDGLSMKEVNLWKSNSYKRIDTLYDLGWFVRLWRVTPDMHFDCSSGLHKQQYPITVTNIARLQDPPCVIHYGFADVVNLAHKFFIYRQNGQSGCALFRLIMETSDIPTTDPDMQKIELKTEPVDQSIIPDTLRRDNEYPPIASSFSDNFKKIYQYEELVFKPGTTFICLIYKSIKWLKLFYEQFLKYTDMTNNEFFFVANDATQDVLEYLKCNRIPHYEYNNTEEQRKEWYINNVYRAYNYGIKKAKGDYVVLLNSDMTFSENWYESLFLGLNKSNCVCSRLVESGRYRSGLYGIESDFGMTPETYNEVGFNNYAKEISENKVMDSGLYMPLLARKQDLMQIGLYPEGNIVPGSNIYNPMYATIGSACIPGDKVLMSKLLDIGIKHQTVFNSIVYHFQAGELSDTPDSFYDDIKKTNMFIICNDYVRGMNGERVLWNYLIDMAQNNYGVDMDLVGCHDSNFPQAASQYILDNYNHTGLVLQNASFIGHIKTGAKKICYLQDNLRKMNYRQELLDQQFINLDNSHGIVTNSVLCAASYPEFACNIIPIGTNSDLFNIKNKEEMRVKHDLIHDKIGIFVGEFTDVKGWFDVKQLIESRLDIFWLIVSKNANDNYVSDNSRMYNKINQELLSDLLSCSDFFILGSSVETLCLAAIEALFCGIPVVMHNTGIFSDMSQDDRDQCGHIGCDLDINAIFENTYNPRSVALKYGLDHNQSMAKWKYYIEHEQLACDSKYYYSNK